MFKTEIEDFFYLSQVSETCNCASDGKLEFHLCRSDQRTQGKPFNRGGERGGSGASGARYVKPRISSRLDSFVGMHISFSLICGRIIVATLMHHSFTVALV
jgi:hypothetical protein